MYKKKIISVHRNVMHMAVVSALSMIMSEGQALADCKSVNGIVNCDGVFAGGASGGAIMVAPGNYTAVSLDSTGNTEALSSTIVGYSNAINYTIAGIGSLNPNVPNFATLNIGSGSTSPVIGTAADQTTTVITGLKAVPGFVDVFNGGVAPTNGISVAQQLANQAGANPLVNFEGVDIQQAGTVNNFGTVTNITSGSSTNPVAGNTFLVTNGPKVYTEGGSDSLPYRTVGVWLNGSSTTLNNYGVINVGVNDNAIIHSQPGVTGANASLYTKLAGSGGSAFSETFNADGSIKQVTRGYSKPTVYAVLSTSDGDDFYSNVQVNNYNTIGAYLLTSNKNNAGSPVAVELKENLLDAHVYNGVGAIIEGVTSSSIFTAGSSLVSGAAWGAGVLQGTYTKSSGGAYAIGTDNNGDLVTVTNDGIIASYVSGSSLYGTAMNLSNARTVITNNADGRIYGDILVANSSNQFTFQNAGILTGNIVVTPNAGNGSLTGSSGSLVPTLQSGSYNDVETATNVVNRVLIQPVINSAGGGNTVAAIGQITGGIYIASGGAASGGHPFELDVQPVLGAGVAVRSGDTYTYSGQNISIAAGAVATPVNAAGNPGTTTQIGSANIQLVSTSPLVQWAFVNGTTNQISATIANASAITGLSGNGQNALNSLMTSASAAAALVQDLTSVTAVRTAAEQLYPEVNGAGIQAALTMADKIFGVVGAHLEQINNSNGFVSAEQLNQPNVNGAWMQGVEYSGDQGLRNGVDGYNATAYGFAIGSDTMLSHNMRVGAAISYGQTSIEDQGVTYGNQLTVASVQGTVYGSLVSDRWYLNGALGLGVNSYDSNRIVVGGNVNGHHAALQYSARIDAGLPLQAGSALVTPVASLMLSRLDQAAYTESGVGALAVNSLTTDSVRTGLGAKSLIPVYTGEVNAGVELRAIRNHEFANTAQNTVAGFVGGGNTFRTMGVTPARDGLDLGVSLVLANSGKDDRQKIVLSYDVETKDQYRSYTARLQARMDF